MDGMNLTSNEKNDLNWLEGLLLLILIIVTILMGSFAHHPGLKTIVDEQVSMWSGSVDNLE